MIHYLPHYVTPEIYAKLCHVKTYTVYRRAEKGRLTLFKAGKKRMVNLAQNPLVKNFHGQQRSQPKPLPAEWAQLIANNPASAPQGLISIKELAENRNIRTDSIYELVIGQQLDAWHMGGSTYVKEADLYNLVKQ